MGTPKKPLSEDDFDPLMTVQQVSELTGISDTTLHDWAVRAENGLPQPGPEHVRLSARHRRWKRSAVRRWIDEAEVKATKGRGRGR